MRGCTGLVAALVMLIGMASTAHGQARPGSQPQDRSPFPPMSGRDKEHDETNSRIEQQQARSRNSDRQKRLVDDTNKLLDLATELKTQVDKTDKDTLSLDVIKKADEIEKLARSVKERMKG